MARNGNYPGVTKTSRSIENATKYLGVYSGVVKKVVDEDRLGRLWVQLDEGTLAGIGNPDESVKHSWVLCNYLSPFAGSTGAMDKSGTGNSQFENTPTSYGFWAIPPDIGNVVLVMFINGQRNYPVWIGCLYGGFHNHAVPGLASSTNHNDPSSDPLPVTEYNKFDATSPNPDKQTRVVHEPMRDTLKRLGLLKDTTRGLTTSSARREEGVPSQVFGISTPGPRLSDDTTARKGGHQFVMDDGDIDGNNELIRLRTRSGAQILLHDSEGIVYIGNSAGTGWVEIGPAGNIDIWGAGSFSIRAEKDINLRADNDVNIHAKGNFNTYVEGFVSTEVKGNYNLTVNGDFMRNVKKNTYSLSANQYINEAKAIHLNGPSANVALKPVKIKKQEITKSQRETDNPKSGSEEVETIVSRYPTQEPYPEHVMGSLTHKTNGLVNENVDDPIQSGSSQPNSLLPDTVIGTPTQNDTPGIWKGREYDRAGKPVWSRIGDLTGEMLVVSVTSRDINTDGLEFIAQFEGFSSSIYLDVGGLSTIGYGHLLTSNEKKSKTISIAGMNVDWTKGISKFQALELLEQDVKIAEKSIKSSISAALTQDQYNALVSWAYNVGSAAVKSSTLVREISKGNFGRVVSELQRWNKVKNQVIAGLVRRRRAEANLFTTIRTV